MKASKYLFVITLTLIFLGFGTAAAQQELAQEAYVIFQKHCLGCHGEHGTFREALIIQSAEGLVATGTVVPRNPNDSAFYRRLRETDPARRMPLGQPPLAPELIETIHQWIAAGAPDWQVQYDVNFITTDAMLEAINEHVQSLPPFDRGFARYFTLTHLYNAGETPEALEAYRIALSKLVNSLSWGSEIIRPQPIDPRRTIFYIDLRHYEWDIRNEAWTQIEQKYPYQIAFNPETQAGLHEKLRALRTEMACDVPFVYVDWFLATASLPPLYHLILDLPETERALEKALGIDVIRNLQNAPGVNVWRAGFNGSRVSANNRVLERHRSPHGAYWRSYDFAGNIGTQNIFTHPVSFKHDGGEVIFNLPNGLQAYYVSDGSGNRINAAPIEIVSNKAASDPTVRNGLSCIGCHTEGMQTFEDQVRTVVSREPDSPKKTQALRLYAEKSEMDAHVAADIKRYRDALEATGGVFGGIEPVHRLYEAFQGPLDASHAAAAVGLETEAFLEKIRERPSLRDLGLGVLEDAGGNVKRDVWTEHFKGVVSALHSPDDDVTRPIDPDPDLRPGDLVTIPDPDLRAAIERALRKAPGAVITAGDMARLTQIRAVGKRIHDLRGLEAATNLEQIELPRNAISDLSPLRGLTRLNNIKLQGNRITDVSPLAGLINVDWLGLEENKIKDLSPLEGLIKLNGIGISENPVSDVSPLAGLVSLERIDAWRTLISDFSVLARLPRLSWIKFGDDRSISALPSLKGLKSLRRLEINECNISNLSGLSELTQLERLTLVNNLISDVSQLRNLTNLKHLNLNANLISDVSPLKNLTKLEVLNLRNNRISDVSPLAGLTNLEQLDLESNAISDFSPLEELSEKTSIIWSNNPGVFLRGGAKITGPWLWLLLPGERIDSSTDLLAKTSNGTVTELKVSTSGAIEGDSIKGNEWTSRNIPSTGRNNIDAMLPRPVPDGVVYGSIALDSPREQETTMYVGSDAELKVWLNGVLVHKDLVWQAGEDYQDSFHVTLKKGRNVLLVTVRTHSNGFFGFAPDAEYTVLPHGTRFFFSTAATRVKAGDTFTLQLKAENISNLAGWQGDMVFDPAVLKANSVSEGSFLKQNAGRTHFLEGTIDNTAGRITSIGAARLSEGGVNGEGTLMTVTFTAVANGESRLALREFQAGSSSGEMIPSRPPNIMITVEEPSISDVGDTKFFSLSTDPTPVRLGQTFTLHFNAKSITDLAGWQVDISFDADSLEALEVNEGDFLKSGGGNSFFLRGTMDNAAGEITTISSARTSGGGVTGTGTLLSVTFMPKTTGETRITLSDFFAGSSSGEAIASEAPEIVITIEERTTPAWDVNADGTTNVLDLILVAQHLGKDATADPQSDVNGDGTINVLDLIVVAQNLGEPANAAAPSNLAMDNLQLDPATIQMWIAQAEAKNDGSLAFRQGIANLQRILASLLPEETALLPNYPNPFNPETWIPYHLAEPADVTVRIYAADGALVRTLTLGHQAAGIYENRTRAAYWDGKNAVGESVASGVYFYTLTAGDFMTTRKMLIRK